MSNDTVDSVSHWLRFLIELISTVKDASDQFNRSVSFLGHLVDIAIERLSEKDLSVDHVRIVSEFDGSSTLSGDCVDLLVAGLCVKPGVRPFLKIKVPNVSVQVHQVQSDWNLVGVLHRLLLEQQNRGWVSLEIGKHI